jgi:hypothetical protein
MTKSRLTTPFTFESQETEGVGIDPRRMYEVLSDLANRGLDPQIIHFPRRPSGGDVPTLRIEGQRPAIEQWIEDIVSGESPGTRVERDMQPYIALIEDVIPDAEIDNRTRLIDMLAAAINESRECDWCRKVAYNFAELYGTRSRPLLVHNEKGGRENTVIVFVSSLGFGLLAATYDVDGEFVDDITISRS